MSNKERFVVAFVLSIVAIMVVFDLLTDSREGVTIWHVLIEGSVGVVALFGVFYVLRGSFHLQHKLDDERQNLSDLKKETEVLREQWRQESKKYVEGLSGAIDEQLSKWGLSNAEKEVAFLLLKGLSLKEVADVRQTSEKTARVQSIAIYSKSGLSGRSELSAFFLEDLLVPSQK